MKRVSHAVDELDDLLDEFETDQELKAHAPYVEEDRLSSLIDRLTTIQAGY